MKLKKIACLLLVAVSVFAMAACKDKNDKNEIVIDMDDPIIKQLDIKDFDGYNFRILTRKGMLAEQYVEEQTGDIINDAIYSRNATVEALYNVKITATETVNGVSYKVYTVPTDRIGKEYTYIFNNNKGAQVEENKKIKFNQDNYLRLTKKYSETVDASNKGKDDPLTLYIRNDKNWTKLNYYMWIPNGATNAGWPGKAADMSKKTKIDNQTYYYVEIGAHSYTRIIINNGSAQTNDLTVKSTTEDIYTANKDNGYCWKGSEQSL